ncbi:unnamed protein product [Adineta ricciae]|uniref:THAP-type domain-containing protein n=1 Tax=Adineta ricciae TaxID=249248 RepID=A0A815TEK7_ADIRI|nr:unnamed protein product [Adineta ricciae]
MGRRCVACLKQDTPTNNSSFHRFPKDPNLQQIWLQLLNVHDSNDATHKRVCDSHFDSSPFTTTSNNQKKLKRLKHGALPTNLTISTQLTSSSCTISTQTDLNLDDLSILFQQLSTYEQKVFQITICIDRFRDDDIKIKYYTGFRSYNQPSNPQAQQDTWSNYKNTNTAKDLQHKHFPLIQPPFLERKAQLSPKKVIETRITARHRIHVERCRTIPYSDPIGLVDLETREVTCGHFSTCSWPKSEMGIRLITKT